MMEAVALEHGFAPEPWRPSEGPSGIADLRGRAFARFEELGFPAPQDEDWRYTSVRPITGTNWALARREPRLTLPASGGLRVRRLSDAAADIEPFLARIAGFDKSPFVALNTAFLEDGLVVEIGAGAVIEEPLEIHFEASGGRRPEASYPRILILAGEGSQAAVVETYAGRGRYFSNAVTEIFVAEGALLEHTKLQQESEDAPHVQTVAVRQARGSRFTSHNIAFGGSLSRTDIRVALDAEGAECTLNGLFVGKGTQHIDTHTLIDHAKPHCTSRELYKGIMDGSSRGVFHGKIIVRPDAQKTDAMQTNKNLLLSRQALVNSTPALEIFADDVKCKHGSTTGQLDAAALFYLRSRGIGEADARALLTYAFAADVAERLRIASVRATVEAELGMRLGGSARVREAAR